MLRIKVTHTNGTEEQFIFNGDVSFVVGRTSTRVIEFSNDDKESDIYYEEGATIVVANWGKGL